MVKTGLKQNKYIGIVGTGRCGTMYACEYFKKAFGLDIGHEKYGQDGIASLYLGSIKHKCFFIAHTLNQKTSPVILHQVRNPMEVISSLINRDILKHIHDELPYINEDEDILIKSAKYYYYWNKRLEHIYNIRLRYRVEDMTEEFLVQWFCNILDITFEHNMLAEVSMLNKKINTGQKDSSGDNWDRKCYSKKYTLFDIYKKDPVVHNMIQGIGKRYGYYF